MQATKIKFENYPLIIFCSNKLIEVSNIIDDKGTFPIEIKKDHNNKPIISITANNNGEPIKVIENNKILFSAIKVNKYLNDSKIEVVLNSSQGKYIIMEFIMENNSPNVNKFDLKPFGYNIYGDEKGLIVGGTTLQNNTFKTNTFISI